MGGSVLSRKKVLLIWVILLLVVSFLCVLLLHILPKLLTPEEKEYVDENANNANYYFYDKLWDVPLEERDDYGEYLDLDRELHYKVGNVERTITADNESSYPSEVLFFKKYFEVIRNGDAEAYGKLFTSSYYSKQDAERKEAFTPQMPYDIRIEFVDEEYVSSASYFTYNVYYKLFHNDGSFRDDIHDGERMIQVVVDDTEGELKISSLLYSVRK